jgi:protein-S-isoprenylcysteine O-methyltransferase Ste14
MVGAGIADGAGRNASSNEDAANSDGGHAVSTVVADRTKHTLTQAGAPADIAFRGIFLLVFLSSLVISGYHRKRARELAGVIPRRAEGQAALLLRAATGLTFFGTFLVYIFSPRRLAWSTLRLPAWLRWASAGLAIACLPLLEWVFVSIGANISETVLTKSTHQLVSHGPYRWIRHPLYAFASLEFLALSLLSGNWFMLTLAGAALLIFRFVVIPKEERNLVRAFGSRYAEYRTRTGAVLPRLRR